MCVYIDIFRHKGRAHPALGRLRRRRLRFDVYMHIYKDREILRYRCIERWGEG